MMPIAVIALVVVVVILIGMVYVGFFLSVRH